MRLTCLLLVACAVNAQSPAYEDPANRVPPLNIYEGTVQGRGMTGDGDRYILVGGQRMDLAPDSHFDVMYGWWVRVACTPTQCWIWLFEER